MPALLCALLVHVQVLGLLHPHAATIRTPRGKLQLRAVGDAVHEGVRPPLPHLSLAAPGAKQKPLAVQVAGLKSPRAFAGALEITARAGELLFVNAAPLEEYVAQVVAAEMPDAPLQAQQALAVVARSFAVHAEQSPERAGRAEAASEAVQSSAGHASDAPLCDTTHCQLYATASAAALRRARAAAEATRDLVLLLSSNRVAPALHHAACGGHTARARELWPAASDDAEAASASIDDTLDLPSLKRGTPACAAGKSDPPLAWRAELSEAELARALGTSAPLSLSIDRSDADGGLGPGWARSLSANGGRPLGADELHLLLGRSLGWNRIRSSRIYVLDSHADANHTAPQAHPSPARFVLRGSGFGHGVGLCQRGAARRAQSGESFRRILSRYFPKLTVGRLPMHPDPG